jgi:hypothetical protein
MLELVNDDSKCAYNEYIIVKNVYTYCPCLLTNLPKLTFTRRFCTYDMHERWFWVKLKPSVCVKVFFPNLIPKTFRLVIVNCL